MKTLSHCLGGHTCQTPPLNRAVMAMENALTQSLDLQISVEF